MNKYLFAGLFLSLLTLISCSQKKSEEKNPPDKEVQQFIFEKLMENKVPSYFENLMKRPSVKLNTVRYLFEEAYPECAGIYDCTGIYSPDLDDGSWVDSVLIAAEESRLGEEVFSFLEDEANFIPPIIEEIAEIPTETEEELIESLDIDTETEAALIDEKPVPEVEATEKRLIDAYSRLKVMEFGSELFFPMKGQNDNSILVHYSNKSAVRLFYDDQFRLIKKELWNMESVENAKIKLVEKYKYAENSKNPVQKIIETDTNVYVSKLNENGLVIRTEKYVTEAASVDLSKQKPVSITNWTYDDKNRIKSEAVTEKGKTQKQVFIYDKIDKLEDNPDNIPPDYEYYENGVLRTKTEYINKGTYSTTIIFDKINSVRADYENYIKVRDVYFMNGVQRRVKNYE